MTYQARVAEGGELILPADLARALGLSPGDSVEVEPGERDLLTLHRPARPRDQVDAFLAERADDWDE